MDCPPDPLREGWTPLVQTDNVSADTQKSVYEISSHTFGVLSRTYFSFFAT
jgi:hypothetical protein